MNRRFSPLIATLFLVAAPAAALAQAPSPQAASRTAPERTIVVTGTGEARAAPDIAMTNFTVLRSAETAREALDAANAAMREVTAGIRALDIADRDLQTSGFSIAPQYRYDNNGDGTQKPPELVAYEVRNSLTVRVRDIARLGEILDRAVTLGVNQGGEISFDVADPQDTRNAARREAVADAMATATILAEAAGVTLGAVREISESAGEMPPQPMARSMKMMAAEAAPSVPVEAGENSFSASVRMVFAIAD
ncbi:SIMPL domain-containing protein [Aurantimonas sp. A2-1-M11]|uniref:SIMPL domain-containing protein n=1 Tax=Aurantimonas sp. A2-1-M11 TaxID=3113712 RepID=UPI002F94C183